MNIYNLAQELRQITLQLNHINELLKLMNEKLEAKRSSDDLLYAFMTKLTENLIQQLALKEKD